MDYEFKFLTGNNKRGGVPLGQPDGSRKTDELLFELQEKKGKLYAELAFFLFSARLRVALEPSKQMADAIAGGTARIVAAVVEHVWTKDDKLPELMADVDAITEEVLPLLRHGSVH